MKNNKKMVAIVLLVSLLSSCARYQSPISGPTATINFINVGWHGAGVFQKPYSCEKLILIPKGEFKIPAEKLFTFNDCDVSPLYSCSIVASFTPDRNQKYIAVFSNKNRHCYVSIREKLSGNSPRYFGSDYLPVKLTKRKYVTGFTTGYCADKIADTHKKQAKIN